MKMNIHRLAALEDILRKVQQALPGAGKEMSTIRELARDAAEAIEALSPSIERHTSVVCPDCKRVCCVNRYSYHELSDIIYLSSLGERPPAYRQGVGDTEPCQFIGERGCTLKRSLRPHRCNWFFCSPLLDHIQASPAREYRAFIAGLEEVNRKRERLITAFGEIIRKGAGDLEQLKRSSDEIFFRNENLRDKFDIL
jgi:hypothetical protein